jgi:hypothetical protein
MSLGAFSISLAVRDIRASKARELQRQLEARGVAFAAEADESSSGPAQVVVTDPDGNPILVDQHV